MKLSIVVPSHNVGDKVNVNIMNVCAMGNDNVEIIIRDNSGNAEKHKFLSQVNGSYCRILSVDECPGVENLQKALVEASGDFVFVACDDDYVNGHAIEPLCAEMDRIQTDPAIIGVTGNFIVEDATASAFCCFNNFNGSDPQNRLHAFLGMSSRSIFQYSPIRRSIFKSVSDYMSSLPVYLSYHDSLLNGLLLAHGRITYVPRYIYQYNNVNWSTPETSLKTDLHYIRQVGLDTSAIRLLCLINGFEGAQSILTKYKGLSLSNEDRLRVSLYWFNYFFAYFQVYMNKQADDAQFDAQALALAMKWKDKKGINLPELLTDISEFYALSSPEIAQRYYDFWK